MKGSWDLEVRLRIGPGQ